MLHRDSQWRRSLILGWLATALLISLPAPAAEPPEPLWTVRYDGPLGIGNARSSCLIEQGAEAIGTDAAGNLYVAGRADAKLSGSFLERWFVAAWSGTGEFLWTRWREESGSYQAAPRLGVRSSGEPRVVAAFPTWESYEVRAYSTDGTELWHSDPEKTGLDPIGVGLDASGGFAVASRTATGGLHLARFLGDGQPDWSLVDYEMVLPDGARVVDGGSILAWGGGGGPQQVARYTIGGSRRWLGAIPQVPDSDDTIRDALVDTSGRVFGTGRRCGIGSCALLTFSLDEVGGFRWADSWLAGAGSDQEIAGAAVALGLGGEIFVGGVANGAGLDAALLRYSEDGILDWARTVDRGSGWDDGLAAVTIRGDGAVQAVGHSKMGPSNDGILVVTATPAGAVSSSFPTLLSSQDETACGAVRVTSDHFALVGDLSNRELRVAELDASANPIWAARQPPMASPDDLLGGWGNDTRRAIAIGPSDDLWLAGATGVTNLLHFQPLVVHLGPDGEFLGQSLPFGPGLAERRDAALCLLPSSDGGAFAAGFTGSPSRIEFVVGLDETLATTATYQDDPTLTSSPKGIFGLEDGTFRVVGLRGDSTFWSYDLLALDEELQPLWHATGSHPSSSPARVQLGEDGNFWVTGYSADGDPLQGDCHTLGFEPDGGLLWESYFGESDSSESCSALSQGSDRVLVAGSVLPIGTSSYVGFVVSYDSNGTEEWSKRGEITPGESWRFVTEVFLAPNGDAILAGSVEGASLNVPVLARLAPDGTTRWSRRLVEPANHWVDALVVDGDGFIYVLANAAVDSLMKFSPDGWKLWGSETPAHWGAFGLALDSHENVIVVGSDFHGSMDIFVTKFPGRLDLFSDSFETGDASRWSLIFP